MSATRTVGLVALVGGAGAAAWMLLSDGNPFAEAVSTVTTRYSGGDGLLGQSRDDSSSTPGPSRAQQLQNLEKDMSRLESEIDAERSRIESEFERRMARATFEGLWDEIEATCSGGWFGNPYGSCDDQFVADYKADTRAWKTEQINQRVRPLERELGEVEAEHESLLLTA